MFDPSVSGDNGNPGEKKTPSLPGYDFHLFAQSTTKLRACDASSRFYQVTSLVTNPTIVAALVHSLMPYGCLPRLPNPGTLTEDSRSSGCETSEQIFALKR